jgi:hypothetical protein
MSLSQYYYGVYAYGVLADTANAGAERRHAGEPLGDEPTPPPGNAFAESSTAQRRTKRAASPDDEEVATGNGKRRRTATEVRRHPDQMDDIPSSRLQLYSLQTDKENPIPCPQCKKMFSTKATLRRHGNCAVGVKDRRHLSCPVEGCKSRQVLQSCTLH